MEDNAVRVNENEEIDFVSDSEETSENLNSGAFVAGIIGGFLAYVAVNGAKKLSGFVRTKLEKRKNKKDAESATDDEVVDVDFEPADSDEEN